MGTTATVGLRKWILRAFVQSALIPLLLVETVLIATYLFSNGAIRDAQISYLRDSAREELQASAALEANIIDEQLADISELTELYRNMVGRALAEPAAAPLDLALSPDGVHYSSADHGGAALFYSNHIPAARHDLEKAARLSRLDPLMKELKDANPLVASLYFNSWDSLNHIYPWFNTLEQYPHDMDIPAFNFYYQADAQHNPGRGVVWTDVYLDPAGHGWMMSAIAPVWRGDFLEGVSGMDITVGGIVEQIDQLKVPWNGYAMLVSGDLSIMALPRAGEDDFALRELKEHSYNEAISRELFKPADFSLNKRAETQALASAIGERQSGQLRVMLGGRPHLVAWDTIARTGWRLLTVVDEADIFTQTDQLAQRYANIGYLLIAGLVLFYVVFLGFMWQRSRELSRQLLRPITGLSRMMDEIGRGLWRPQPVESPIVELDRLSGHALAMGEQLESSEDQRDRAQRRLELVLESATEGLWELDLERKSIELRGRFAERFGLPGTVLELSQFSARVHADDLTALRAALQGVQDGLSDYYEAEIRYADAQGRYRWLLVRGRVLERDPATAAVHLMAGTLVDIETLKRVQVELRLASQEAQAASQAKSRFMSSVTHELRTPLNAILGFTQLLRMEHPPVAGQRDHLEEILLASHHLNQLVGDLLDWSSLQAEKPSFKLQALNVRELFTDCAELIRAQAENLGLSVHLELPAADVHVLAEPRRLRQVLLNLLSNAIKYNRAGGRITLSCQEHGERLRLLVEDTGLGLDAAQQAMLFEPFQRLGRENTAIQGTGIGLVLSRDLASLMGGQIGVQSEQGVGSCFWVELARPAAPEAAVSSMPARRVIYADAEIQGRQRVQAALDGLVSWRAAVDAADLLQLLQHEPADLLLLDQHLPGAELGELLRQIRQDPRLAGMLVVLLCAPGQAADLMLLNCQGLLGKPVDIDELLGLVEALLGPEVEHVK